LRTRRMREQALALYRARRRRRRGVRRNPALAHRGDNLLDGRGDRRDLAPGAGRRGRLRIDVRLVRLDRARRRLELREVAPRDGVELRDTPQVRVRVLVAVHVLLDDVVAELLARADLLDDPVVDRDDRRALAG